MCKRHMWLGLSLMAGLALVLTWLPATRSYAAAPAAGLLLYNTLDSPAAIRNSAVGLDGTHHGGGRFVPGRVGNAFVAGPGDEAQVTFPSEVLNYRAGTIELWAKISDIAGREIPWGPQPALINYFEESLHIDFDLHYNGNNGAGGGGLCGTAGKSMHSSTGDYGRTWTYDELIGTDVEGWHHYALVWDDAGLPGVDGGRAKVAVYLDGVLKSGQWLDYDGDAPDFLPIPSGVLRLRDDSEYHSVFWGDVTYDELKIWDHARIPSPAWAHLPQAELVGTVGGPGAEVDYVDAMEVLESDPRTMILATQNFYLGSGAGEEARIYRLDLRAGGPRPAALVQILTMNWRVMGALYEASNGSLFAGGFGSGWGHYSTDAGATWQPTVGDTASFSVFSFGEFKGQLYAGSAEDYEFIEGSVLRWLGDGAWERVYVSGLPSSAVNDLEVHQGRLFVGNVAFGCAIECDRGEGVLVSISDDGMTFTPTGGIPRETMSVHSLVSLGDELLAMVNLRADPLDRSIYRWTGQEWAFVTRRTLLPPLNRSDRLAFSYEGALYDLARLPDNTGDGLYRSTDLGRSWQMVAFTQGPIVYSAHRKGSILYLGSNRAADGTASIYRIDLASLATFPTTPILDAFSKSNGPLRSSWSGNEGRGGYQIIGRQLDVVGGGPISWSRSFGADQEVYVTLVHPDAEGASQSLILKMQGRATRPWQQLTMLAVGHEYAAGANRLVIDRHIPGAGWVRLAERSGVILRDGDQLGARATADGMVRVYLNGVEQLSADAGPRFAGNGGRIGLWFIDAGEAWLDDVGGGTLP